MYHEYCSGLGVLTWLLSLLRNLALLRLLRSLRILIRRGGDTCLGLFARRWVLSGLGLSSRGRVLLGVLPGYGGLALLWEVASERRDGELAGLRLGFLLAVAHDNERTNAANNNNSKDQQKDPLCRG